MLPTYTAAGTYHATSRKSRHKDDTPWAIIIILILAGTCALVTRHQSIATGVGQASQPRELLERHTHTEVEELAKHNFNSKLHSLYKKTPRLREITDQESHGAWDFNKAVYDYAANHPAAEILSFNSPRLIKFKSFLTPAEVGHMVDVASEHLERSEVISANDTQNSFDNIRTSFGAWPPPDIVIDRIENRIHRLLGIPRSFGEAIYVLNYKLNQKYDAHRDNCMDDIERNKVADEACKEFLLRAGGPKCGVGHGGSACGDRIATFILMLKSPSKGGRTVFPMAALTQTSMKAAGKESLMDSGEGWYCQHDEVLGDTASPGDALLFWDYRPSDGSGTGSFEDGTADPNARPVPESMHSGCPVLSGEKWIATRWIRSAEFF